VSNHPARQPRPGQTSGAASRRVRRPRSLPPGDTLFSPQASPARQEVERRSATLLLWLHQLPVWLPAVLAVGLLVAGLAVPGAGGAAALCGLAAVLGWLAVISWPRLSGQGRALRVVVIAAVVVVAVIRALHR